MFNKLVSIDNVIGSNLNGIHMLEQHNVSDWNILLNVKNKNTLDEFISY